MTAKGPLFKASIRIRKFLEKESGEPSKRVAYLIYGPSFFSWNSEIRSGGELLAKISPAKRILAKFPLRKFSKTQLIAFLGVPRSKLIRRCKSYINPKVSIDPEDRRFSFIDRVNDLTVAGFLRSSPGSFLIRIPDSAEGSPQFLLRKFPYSNSSLKGLHRILEWIAPLR